MNTIPFISKITIPNFQNMSSSSSPAFSFKNADMEDAPPSMGSLIDQLKRCKNSVAVLQSQLTKERKTLKALLVQICGDDDDSDGEEECKEDPTDHSTGKKKKRKIGDVEETLPGKLPLTRS